VRQVRSDDLGRYRIHSLLPGEYYVDAAPDPLRAVVEPVLVNSPRLRPTGLARTYFPGTPELQEARGFTLAVGQEVRGADFVVIRVPLARVTGQVLDSSGKPAPPRSVRLQPIGAPSGDARISLAPQSHRFTMTNVPPGEYWLTAATASPPGGDPEFAALRIVVSGQDLDEVSLLTAKGAAIEGRVQLDGGGPPPASMSLRITTDATDFDLPGPPVVILIDAAGRFSTKVLFGSHVIRLGGLPTGWALKGIWFDGAEITDTAAEFRAGPGLRPMRVVITDKTATLSGAATNSRNVPVADYRVVVFPEDEALWGQSRFVKSIEARNGRFSIEGLLPGKYLVCAVDDLEDGAWTDLAVLGRLHAFAIPIALAEGETQQITLKVRATP
jgi:hypothetical protein